jgi:hypothetical protein
MKPDLAGFKDAQARKREFMGEDVTFLGEVLMQFPPGTRIDPETHDPYDPTVQPTASAQASATVRVGVAFRPVTDDAKAAAIGWTEDTHVMLSAPPILPLGWAQEFVLRGERYKITAMKPDGIGPGDAWRNLIHGRRE